MNAKAARALRRYADKILMRPDGTPRRLAPFEVRATKRGYDAAAHTERGALRIMMERVAPPKLDDRRSIRKSIKLVGYLHERYGESATDSWQEW